MLELSSPPARVSSRRRCHSGPVGLWVDADVEVTVTIVMLACRSGQGLSLSFDCVWWSLDGVLAAVEGRSSFFVSYLGLLVCCLCDGRREWGGYYWVGKKALLEFSFSRLDFFFVFVSFCDSRRGWGTVG